MKVYRENSAFWYIVLQDVVLKDVCNSAVLNLAPGQMILVDNLWLLGANKILAHVVYPAKGYVPRERSTCGQLITPLNPFGIQQKLSKLPLAYHVKTDIHNLQENHYVESWRRLYPTQEFNNFDDQLNPNFINSESESYRAAELKNEKSHLMMPKLECRKSLIKRLVSIYHSDEGYIQTEYEKCTENAKNHNAVSVYKIFVTKPKGACYNVTPIREYRKHWRQDTERWVTVSALCHALQVICCKNECRGKSKRFQPNTIFESPDVPDISLSAYLKRIAWFLGCSTACFVLAFEYICRLAHQCPEIEVNNKSVHQIVITCIMVATKFIDDKKFKNTFYARVAGLPVANLSALEVRLLFLLKFDVSVPTEQYNARYAAMLADNQGSSMVLIRPQGITVDGEASYGGLRTVTPSA